jgi:hypothetical protein
MHTSDRGIILLPDSAGPQWKKADSGGSSFLGVSPFPDALRNLLSSHSSLPGNTGHIGSEKGRRNEWKKAGSGSSFLDVSSFPDAP